MTVIDLNEFKVDMSTVKLLRTEYHHMAGAVEEIEVYECSCKLVFVYNHLNENYNPDMGFGSCNVEGCNGYQAYMSASKYVFVCEDHSYQ